MLAASDYAPQPLLGVPYETVDPFSSYVSAQQPLGIGEVPLAARGARLEWAGVKNRSQCPSNGCPTGYQ
jgi:hypothetical protein